MKEATRSDSVFFSYGFRPFFLSAAAWAIVDILVWITLFEHGGKLPSRFDALSWHIHEMLFGFIMAAITGFLLTAVANWTGRPPIRGPLLGLLITAWSVGRLACLLSSLMPPWLTIVADLALPGILIPLLLREIIAARNWRNLVMVLPVLVLAAANLLMHLESFGVVVPAGLGWRLGIAAVLTLVSAVGGRIVPAFTRNWLVQRGEEGSISHGKVDRWALGVLHTALFAWAFFPGQNWAAALLLIAAVLNAWRLILWRGFRTRDEPLLLVLHIGYAWLILGVALLGLSMLSPGVPQTAALHSLTVGAMATMILAVMTRATRGHTGRPLIADAATSLAYILIFTAAATRVTAAFLDSNNTLLISSAVLWTAAFVVFAGVYGPMLLRPRVSANG